MFTDQELEIYAQRIVDIYEPITQHYLELMGEHMADIGTLTATDVHRLTQIQRMNKNAAEIASELAIATQKAESEIEAMFEEMAQDHYAFSEQYYDAQGLVQVPWSENKTMQQIVAAQVKTTQGTLANLASTTASQLKKTPTNYRQLVDAAIRQASLGTTDYSTAIRNTVRSVAKQNVSYIDFDSGYKRRLDSQIRMNILDGARTQAINIAEQAGKEYGADGVEISAHGLCAADHLHIQGQQYTTKKWNETNANLDRAIGTLNCKHFAFPILLGISTPAHTQKELAAINKTSTATTTIGDKTLTGYQWSQEQRKLETLIREQKDIAVLAAAAGDDYMPLRREAQAKINAYKAEYATITEQATLIEKTERMTVSGYHYVKAS